MRPSRATWPPSRWCPTRPGERPARACPWRGAPRGATPASPDHEAGRGPARDVAGSRPAPQGLGRTRGLETGSPALPGRDRLKRLPNGEAQTPAKRRLVQTRERLLRKTEEEGTPARKRRWVQTRDAAHAQQQEALGVRCRRTAMPPHPPTVCGEPQAEAQTTAAWDLPIGAVGDGSAPHQTRSGGGPRKGFLADTRRCDRGWVCGKFQMPEDLADHLAVRDSSDDP